MIICFFVITFFAVVLSGPAGLDWVEERRVARDRPMATVHYLPTASCRDGGVDPVLVAVRHRRRGCKMPPGACAICDERV